MAVMVAVFQQRPPQPSAVPPLPAADGSLPLLHAASRGDLRLFKSTWVIPGGFCLDLGGTDSPVRRVAGLVRDLDQGRGRPREVVEAAKDQGLVALHFAAGKGRPRVCRYLVEELGVDVDAVNDGGAFNLPLNCKCV